MKLFFKYFLYTFLLLFILLATAAYCVLYLMCAECEGIDRTIKRNFTTALHKTQTYQDHSLTGVNVKVHMQLEYKGKPYEISSIVRCVRDASSYYFSRYKSYSVRTENDEAIILLTEPFCDASLINEISNHGSIVKALDTYKPLLAIADHVNEPNRIEFYITNTAYENDPHGLKHVSTEISKAAQNAWKPSIAMGDPSRYLGFNHEKYKKYLSDTKMQKEHGVTTAEFFGHNFVKIPQSTWSRKENGETLTPELVTSIWDKIPLQLDKKSCQEFLKTYQIKTSPEVYMNDRGIIDMPSNLKNVAVNSQSIIPFRNEKGEWYPDYKHVGKYILYSPYKVAEKETIKNAGKALAVMNWTSAQPVEISYNDQPLDSCYYIQGTGDVFIRLDHTYFKYTKQPS